MSARIGLLLCVAVLAGACGGAGSDGASTAGGDAAGGDAVEGGTADGSATDGSAADGSAADGSSDERPPDGQRYPDVLDASIEQTAEGTFEVAATLSSPYDSPERYADAWRVLGPDGDVLGVRELLHDHANEQPFTRSLSDVEIPDDLREVTIEGRDLRYGWGGGTVTVEVPGR